MIKSGEKMEFINNREEKIVEDNTKVFALLSRYLNQVPDFITYWIEKSILCYL